jgi:hypothetical protein
VGKAAVISPACLNRPMPIVYVMVLIVGCPFFCLLKVFLTHRISRVSDSEHEPLSPGGPGMMKPGYFQRLARLGAGTLVVLVAQGLCVPCSAQAGCNHLVVSRNDAGTPQSILDRMLDDLAGRSDGNPVSPPARPCSGAFCAGQPATPAVPAGAFDLRADSWAWCGTGSGTMSGPGAFFSVGCSAPHSVVRVSGIFHPPRFLS